MGTRYPGTRDEIRALDAFIKLARAHRAVVSRLDAGLKEHGLTEVQLGVLEALLHLGPSRQCDLGRKQLTSAANVTLVVDRLADRGWVRRERDPDDRRAVRVHLTDEGRTFIESRFPEHVAGIVALFEVLEPREQDELARLCRKLGRAAAREAGTTGVR